MTKQPDQNKSVAFHIQQFQWTTASFDLPPEGIT